MAAFPKNSFLASVISDARGGYLAGDGSFRRYKATVQTSAILSGVRDTRTDEITYEVGRAGSQLGPFLAKRPDSGICVESAYPTSSVLSEEFLGLAKKYTNFSSTFQFCSLAGVVERLGIGLAACSVFEDVDSNALRGGNPLRIQALSSFDGPVNSLTSTVFIPRLVNKAVGVDTFAVLVGAVAGEGGSVATDVLELDVGTRQPVIGVVDGPGFAMACVEALRILGANMIASDQGPLFAYALTRGLHRVVSVVAHTDEGGVMRELLRAGRFGVPFGGIHCGLETYAGLPALATNGIKDVAVYVDSLALVTAALVAHCDPGVRVKGEWFPFTLDGTSSGMKLQEAGESLEGDASMSRNNRSMLLAGLTPFWFAYCGGLGKIFGADGDPTLASSVASAQSLSLGQDSRHLRMPSVSPFFWVEPTSLLPHDLLGSEAEAHGCGALASPHAARVRPAWEDACSVGEGDISRGGYIVRARNARSAWFLAHWNGHPDNGLSCVKVHQLDPYGIVHPGQDADTPLVRDRVASGKALSSFLWKRGQSPFCAPGEFINLNCNMGIYVIHCSYSDDDMPKREHVPSARDFVGCTVEVYVGKPHGISSGRSNYKGRTAMKARTQATRELALAAERVRIFDRPDTGAMMITMATPVFPGKGPILPLVSDAHNTGGGITGVARAASGGPTPKGEPQPQGDPVPATMHHGSATGPQMVRATFAAPRTGGRPEPPAPAPAPSSGAEDQDIPVAPVGAAPPSGPTAE
ncbi:MAG: coat protein [Hangzhou totivirus 3]|nr:MAG: coat protein [Hangzhou totivirus 3]